MDDGYQIFNQDSFEVMKNLPAESFDMIFADPPYDHPKFAEIPELILKSQMLNPGTIVIIEHSKEYDFSHLENFDQHRTYGSVNFSIFRIPE